MLSLPSWNRHCNGRHSQTSAVVYAESFGKRDGGSMKGLGERSREPSPCLFGFFPPLWADRSGPAGNVTSHFTGKIHTR